MTRRLPRAIQEAMNRLEPQVRDAFLAAIGDIRKAADPALIARLIEAGDIEGAVQAMRFEASLFGPLDRALEESYRGGGIAAIASLPAIKDPFDGSRLVMGFDGRHPRAERWGRNMSSRLVQGIAEEQRQVVRGVIVDGLASGRAPRATALDLVGRINPVTRRREGGYIGLADNQAGWVRNARADLEAGRFADYRRRELRDKRYDKLIDRLEREGRVPNEAELNRITNAYQQRVLRYRGETIARTETLTAYRAGRSEGFHQLRDTGAVRDDQFVRKWSATGDKRTRDSHDAMNDETVRGLDTPWQLETGTVMYPGDPDGTAAAEDTIQCRCFESITIEYDVIDVPVAAPQVEPTIAPITELALRAAVWQNKTDDEITKVAPAFSDADVSRIAIIEKVGDLRGGVKSGKGSHHRSSDMSIQMDAARTGEAYNRVMRHEYGHHIDARIEQVMMQNAGVSGANLDRAKGVSRLARGDLKADAIALEKTVSADYRNVWTGQSNPITAGFADKVLKDRSDLISKFRKADRNGNQGDLIKSEFASRGLNYEDAKKIFPHIFEVEKNSVDARTNAARLLSSFDNGDHVDLVYRSGRYMTHESPLSGLSDSLGAATNQRLGYQFGHDKGYYAKFRSHDKKTSRFYSGINPLGDDIAPTGGKYAYGHGNTAQLWANWFEAYTSGNETQYAVFKKFFPSTSRKFENITEGFVDNGTI